MFTTNKNVFAFIKICLMVSFVVFSNALWQKNLFADDVAERRIQISLSVFPRIIAVDKQFRSKLAKDKHVKLFFVYASAEGKANNQAMLLRKKINNIAGMKFESMAVSLETLLAKQGEIPTGIFISEKLSYRQLKQVVEYANKQQRIVFSPFAGDVEQGATAGIAITSRVKPYFNMKTIRNAGIVIDELLLKISKRYE